MKDMWWKCPNCSKEIDFENQLKYVFDSDDNEADFDPIAGLWLHTIECDCGAAWYMSISKMNIEK